MSTPGSEKLRLSLAALAVVGLVFAVTDFGLARLALWAERDFGAYPYGSEDWLRYQLPHMFERFSEGDGPHILVTGPSTIREDVLVDLVEAKIPSARAYQGGLSLGTLDDVNASLDYLESAYGVEALPDVILLGLTPRFLANEPDDRPFLPAVDQYSPYFRIEPGPTGPILAPKGPFEATAAWLRFRLTKQSDRYRTAVVAACLAYVQSVRARCADTDSCPYGWPLAIVERLLSIQRLVDLLYLNWVTDVGIDAFLEVFVAPAKYRFYPPRGDAWLRRNLEQPDTFWRLVFAWDPAVAAPDVLPRIARLRNFTDRHGIRLVVVNLPENDLLEDYYPPGRYAAYRALIARGFEGIPWVDMRRFLGREEFIDAEHAVPPGARRFTEALLPLLEPTRSPDRMQVEIREYP